MEARKLHSEGWSNRNIANKYGVNIGTMQQAITGITWKRANSTNKYKTTSFNRRVSRAGIDKIVEMHRTGYEPKQISSQLKISKATVIKYIRQNIPDAVFKPGRPRKKK